MTPTELIQLAEAKDLLKNSQFEKARGKLNYLIAAYPNDSEIRTLLKESLDENTNSQSNQTGPTGIKIEGISFSVGFTLLFIFTLSIILAWFVIFFLFGFHFQLTPLK
jgi:hypothetical protein